MAENDTGKYEVKINSISYEYGRDNSPDCGSLVLHLLEAQAAHAPVTFMVQEQYVPASSIFSTHYVTNDTDDHSIELRSAPLNSSLLDNSTSSNINWYKNGTRIFVGGNEEELSLIYSSTATVIGDYVRILRSRRNRWDTLSLCRGYYYYVCTLMITSVNL